MALLNPESFPGLLGHRPNLAQRVMGGLGQVFGGMDDPNLSAQQNAMARRRAIMQAGLATMAAGSQPGASTLGALAQGAMFGQQAGDQNRMNLYGATQEERVRQALQDPEVTGKLNPQQMAMIRLMPPHEAAKLLTQMAFQPAPGPVTLAKDSILIDPVTRQTIASNPGSQQAEIPAELRGIATLMGADPSALDALPPNQRAALLNQWETFRRAGATSVNIDTGKQSQRGMTESMVKLYDQQSGRAQEMESRLESLSVMESLLDQGLKTGGVENMTQPWRSIGASLGVANAEQLGMQELFKGLSNKMALEMKEGMTGQMSDRDIEFLQKQAPQLANTPEGNRLMIDVLRRFARRQIEIADQMDQYVERNNGSLLGWRSYRSQWIRENPLRLDDLYGRKAPFAR